MVDEWDLLVVMFVFFLLIPYSVQAGRITSLEGNFFGNMNGEGDGVEQRRFYQRYHVQATHDPTDTMSTMWDINYTRNWNSEGPLVETLTPNLTYTWRNDLFLWDNNFLYTKNHQETGFDNYTRSWQTNLTSLVRHKFLPEISGNFGQIWSSDGKEPHEKDTKDSFGGINVDYTLEPIRLQYNFYRTYTEDRPTDSTSATTNHFGRAEFNRSFFEDRFHMMISHQISRNITKFDANASPGKPVEAKVHLSEVLIGNDDTPEEGSLPVETRLWDDDRDTLVFTISDQEPTSIGFNTSFKVIDKVYIYTDPDPMNLLSLSEAKQTSWDMYISSDGNSWTLIKNDVPFSYDPTEKRFVFSMTNVKSLYVKLVITNWPELKDIGITEVEAYRVFNPNGSNISSEDKFTQRITNLTLSGRPTERSSFNYSLILESDTASSGISQDYLSQAGSINFEINDYFNPSISINHSVVNPSEGNDTENRSYALTVVSRPLPTTNISLGITRNETFVDDATTSVNHDVNLLATAILYPDLTSSLDFIYSRTKNYDIDTLVQTYYTRLTFTARLRQSLTADLTTEYRILREKKGHEGGRTTLSLNWRPSDILSVILDTMRGYGDQSDTKVINLNVSASLVRTRMSQLTLTYLFQKSDRLNQYFNLNWSWDISDFLTLNTSSTVQMGEEEDRWNIQANLSARF